jgi:hypothetical protein
MFRNVKFGIVTAALVLIVIELQSWAFVHWAMSVGAFRFYPADVFSRWSDEQITQNAVAAPLGWPRDDAPRAAPPVSSVCGSAFGASNTYGAEVKDEEAWLHVLSLRLGCTVANYAVGAYGLDQAVLRYERIETEGKFVILGLDRAMFRRNLAASWTFFAPMRPASVYQVKPYFTLDGDGLRLHPIPKPLTVETIEAHHADDYYLRHVATAARFPFMAAAAHAIYVRLARPDDYRGEPNHHVDPGHPSGSGVLTTRLIDQFVQTARRRDARPVLVLLTPAGGLRFDDASEVRFYDALRRRSELCVIDVKPTLREHARALGGTLPTAPNGHYAASGNQMIADAVAEGLGRCRIAP